MRRPGKRDAAGGLAQLGSVEIQASGCPRKIEGAVLALVLGMEVGRCVLAGVYPSGGRRLEWGPPLPLSDEGYALLQ